MAQPGAENGSGDVAARLCAEAKDGQILLSQRVNVALKGRVATE
jgi:class 3 adenylate cyclase